MNVTGAFTTVRKGSLGVAVTRFPLAFTLALLPIAALLGWTAASQPELYRPLFALGTVLVLGLLALRWPNAAILGGLLFLPLLGLIRRLLIGSTGWPEVDPLLLIGPALAVILFVRAYVLESRPLAPDLLSKLVLGLLVLILLGVFNPLGAGLDQTAIAAFVLTAIPPVWFFVGRALPDRITIARLQHATCFLAGLIAVYGLYQTEVGFPNWDLEWIDVGGYVALNVGDQVRAWGTMASAAEYAGYLGAGIVIAVAALLHRRAWPIVLIPLLCVALLFSAVRTFVVLGLIALVVMFGLRSRHPRIALPAIAVAGIVTYLLAVPALASVSAQSDDLIGHQLGGIAQPFDEEDSTLEIHLALIGNGFAEGIQHPLGQGIAPADLAQQGDLTFKAGGTEFDFSDAFVNFGLPGGLLYLSLAGVAFAIAGRHYMRTRDPLFLGAIGLALVTLGSWLNGGHYSLSPLVWVMLGWATRPLERSDQPPLASQPPR